MPESEAIERRLSAVERAIADGDGDVPALAEASDRERRLRAVEDRLAELDERVTELEAATQALRGYVGNVRSVNEDVEQRADAALAAVERLEGQLSSPSKDHRRNGGRTGDGLTTASSDDAHHSSGRPAPTRPDRRSRSDASPLDGVDARAEMPVSGASDGTPAVDTDDHDVAEDGALDRVRDAL
jgi:hypothetical protein